MCNSNKDYSNDFKYVVNGSVGGNDTSSESSSSDEDSLGMVVNGQSMKREKMNKGGDYKSRRMVYGSQK